MSALQLGRSHYTNNWGIGSVAKADRGIFGESSGDATTYGGKWLNYTSAMGLNTIILKRKNTPAGVMKVRFDGGASLGGTTTIPFGGRGFRIGGTCIPMADSYC